MADVDTRATASMMFDRIVAGEWQEGPLVFWLHRRIFWVNGEYAPHPDDETAAMEWHADVAMKADGYEQTAQTVSDDLLAWQGERREMRVTVVMLRPADAARADDPVLVELAAMLREAQPEMRGMRCG